jgi:hypothetical protein
MLTYNIKNRTRNPCGRDDPDCGRDRQILRLIWGLIWGLKKMQSILRC